MRGICSQCMGPRDEGHQLCQLCIDTAGHLSGATKYSASFEEQFSLPWVIRRHKAVVATTHDEQTARKIAGLLNTQQENELLLEAMRRQIAPQGGNCVFPSC